MKYFKFLYQFSWQLLSPQPQKSRQKSPTRSCAYVHPWGASTLTSRASMTQYQCESLRAFGSERSWECTASRGHTRSFGNSGRRQAVWPLAEHVKEQSTGHSKQTANCLNESCAGRQGTQLVRDASEFLSLATGLSHGVWYPIRNCNSEMDAQAV